MKHNGLLAAISLFSMTWNVVHAEGELKTVSMKPGYTDQVYVSLNNGVVKNSLLNDWDLGFEIKNISSSILLNEGKGLELYYVPNSTEETYSQTLDAANLSTWERVINSPTDWSKGAFTRGLDYNTGNFGWGEYNMGTHTITGNAVFVIKAVDNSMKKVFITALAAGKYLFKYANLDGTDEVSAEINKADFTDKNFGYYSLTTKKTVDIEPENLAWDIVFGKYVDYASDGQGNTVPYGVSGIRSNFNTAVVKIENGATQTTPPDDALYTYDINGIGYKWKAFSGTAWAIDNTSGYFVKTQQGKLFKIVFQDFGGSATGTTTYRQEEMQTSSVTDNEGNSSATFALYPNVTTSSENVQIVLVNGENSRLNISVKDVAGNTMFVQSGLHHSELQTMTLPNLPVGMYFVSVGNAVQKLVVVR